MEVAERGVIFVRFGGVPRVCHKCCFRIRIKCIVSAHAPRVFCALDLLATKSGAGVRLLLYRKRSTCCLDPPHRCVSVWNHRYGVIPPRGSGFYDPCPPPPPFRPVRPVSRVLIFPQLSPSGVFISLNLPSSLSRFSYRLFLSPTRGRIPPSRLNCFS